jgi:hypothetical protein
VLRSCGDAIHTALDAYRIAAAALNLPRRALTWQAIVDMATLADFDLLRDTKNNILTESWTKPEVREAMALHFQLKRAREEVHRLNIEIQRQCTYMQDEYLIYDATIDRLEREAEVALDNINACGLRNLAACLRSEQEYQSIIYSHVTYHLLKASKLRGFSGTLKPGQRKMFPCNSEATLQSLPKWILQLQDKTPGITERDEVSSEPECNEGDEKVETTDDEALEDNLLFNWVEKLG